MLRVWNVTLVIVTFFLTIFGTFMTRSGVVQSVHAFGEDPELARLFTVFMVVDPGRSASGSSSTGCRCCGAQRARLVGVARGGVPGQQLDPAVLARSSSSSRRCSRRSARRSPASASPSARRSSTSGWCRSASILLFLTGVGPLLAWRKSTLDRTCATSSCGPIVAGVVTAGGARRRSASASGRRVSCFALCAFVIGHDRAGVLARRARAPEEHRHRPLHGAHRPRRPQQAALRRLHRPRRHRADLPRLRGRRLQARRAGAAEARAADDRSAATRSGTTA